MRVLVTGHRGYVGSVLTSVLRQHRFDVFGLDAGWFDDCGFGRVREDVPSFDMDVRDIEFTDLLSFDAVIHLAGLSDDTSGSMGGQIRSINVEGAVRLAECCKRANVSRFLFASSCSVYGGSGGGELTEESPLVPLSEYARSKFDAEIELLQLADSSFKPVIIRSATIFGMSPSLRLDLVVNDMVASAMTTGRVVMRSSGGSWRPFVHVEDAARAYAAIAAAPDEQIDGQVFNLISDNENHRIAEVADLVTENIPHSVRAVHSGEDDRRSYRVSGEKFRTAFPEFRFRWNLKKGIMQLAEAFRSAGLSTADWRSDRYRRSARIQGLMERGSLSHDLRVGVQAVA